MALTCLDHLFIYLARIKRNIQISDGERDGMIKTKVNGYTFYINKTSRKFKEKFSLEKFAKFLNISSRKIFICFSRAEKAKRVRSEAGLPEESRPFI